MSDKFQTNIDLQGNAIEKGSFERLETAPTEDNFLGRQIELDGIPHFYNGEEFESFWRGKKANAENGIYELDINTPYPDSLYSLIIAKYGNIDNTREIKVNVFVSNCAINLYGNWPRNIRYNIHIQSFLENSIKVVINSMYSVNGIDYLTFAFPKQFSVISSSFINILGLNNPVFAGIPTPEVPDLENFWDKNKANAEVPAYWMLQPTDWSNFKGAFPYFLEKNNNNYLASRNIFLNTCNLMQDIQDILGIKDWSDISNIPKNVRYEVIFCDLGVWRAPRYFYIPVIGYMCTNITTIVNPDFDPNSRYYQILYTGSLKCSIVSCPQGVFVNVSSASQGSLPASQGTLLNSKTLIKNFCIQNNIPYSTVDYINSHYFNAVDVLACLIERLNQGGGGATTGDFWDLLKANPEVSTALFKPLNTDTGVFAHLYADSRLDESRDIIVDFSTYAGGRVFTDFFSAYNLDNNTHPYSWTDTNENSEKMKYVRYKMLLCNNPYTHPIAICVPDNPNIITNFSEVMTGLTYPNETQARYFYLFPNQSINVDFELIYLTGAEQPILAVININSFTGTATFDAQRTSSTENGTVISNYLTSNNIPCTVDKVTGQTLYNVQDLLANIITQINS